MTTYRKFDAYGRDITPVSDLVKIRQEKERKSGMDEKSYTPEELMQAAGEVSFTDGADASRLLPAVIRQADSNRSRGEFTEEQVRDALEAMMKESSSNYGHRVDTRGLYASMTTFANDFIKCLRGSESKPEPAEGGVYRYAPKNTLYRRQQGCWQMFGKNWQLTDQGLPCPWEEMERVL